MTPLLTAVKGRRDETKREMMTRCERCVFLCLTPFIKVQVQISFDLTESLQRGANYPREAEPTESPTANLVKAFRSALIAPADPKVE